MQLIVLGMHRSGTSAATRLLNLMGAYLGAEGASIGFNDENPKGFFERRDVIELNDALLEAAGCHWQYLASWQGVGEARPEHLHAIKSLVLEMDMHRPWAIKDPRLCLTFGAWRSALEHPVVVLVHRDPVAVAKSLETRNGIPLHVGIALWERYMTEALNAARGLPIIQMQHEKILQDPVGEAKKLYHALTTLGVKGLREPDEKEVLAFIDPSLNRSGRAHPAHEHYLNAPQIHLNAILSEQAPLPQQALTCSPVALSALAAYLPPPSPQEVQAQKDMMDQLRAMRGYFFFGESGQRMGQETPRMLLDGLKKQVDNQARLHCELQRFSAYIDRYGEMMRLVEGSLSWRVGNRLVRLLNRLRGRQQGQDIFHEARTLYQVYAHRKKAR